MVIIAQSVLGDVSLLGLLELLPTGGDGLGMIGKADADDDLSARQ
jgi:hypothetical protein